MGDLKEEIKSRKCGVSIIGLGHIGLPLAAIIAEKGFTVLGADLNPGIIEAVNSGRAAVHEEGLQRLIKKGVNAGRLRATVNPGEAVGKSDIVLIVVQTPINEDNTPDLGPLKKACAEVSKSLRRGQLIIIESTLPPGAAKEVITPLLEAGGLRAGEDFYLAYSPERAMPTRTLAEIQSNARLIGGINQESAEIAREFYKQITRGELILADTATVEVVKLIENTYRDVNIALANEIAMFCEGLGVDALKAITLANKHPRVHLHLPGAGVGGHCIPKDPRFILNKAEQLGIKLEVIEAARRVNEAMPKHVVRMIKQALGSVDKRIEDSKIAILGIAYKGDTDDVRGTPAKVIVEELLESKSFVYSHDPYVKQDFGGMFSNDLEKVVSKSDCVVVVTDHSLYKSLDFKELAKQLKTPSVVVDARRILDPEGVKDSGLRYFGVGY
jgi:UDP-N-acetyl-D-mannosaminuronic acid dehydrogenase